jgi:hypothetical protein
MLRRVSIATLLLICASPLFAQQYENARRLGGPTAFYRPPLTDAGSLKRMAERPNIAQDIRTVMRDAGIPEVADAFVAAISRGTSTRVAGNCSTAAPGDDVVECQEPVGATYEWMAYRNLVNRRRVPARKERVRWAGRRSFAAFLVRVTVSDKLYTFIVPKPCANFSLLSVGASPAAVAAAQQAERDRAAREQASREQSAREQAARDQAARDQAARDQAGRDQAAREQAARVQAPSDQAARDQAARDQAARDQAARDQAAREQTGRNAANAANPPVQPPPNPGAQSSTTTTQTTTAAEEKDHPSSPFFIDLLAGGERRNRPADLSEGKGTDYTQGSGFIGLKAGVAKKFESNWELGGAVGVGAMFLFKHDTTNQWPWFAELEVNKYFGPWFVGTGFSIWDFTRSDLWTPSADVRFGIPLGHHPKHPIYFLGEGRWYLDHRTHIETHRQMWGGLRIHF